jgi:hypothetical protein
LLLGISQRFSGIFKQVLAGGNGKESEIESIIIKISLQKLDKQYG